VRHRDNLIRSCVSEIQHMQKALQQMNVKLTNVISDITGVTGMKIMRDIVAGERDPNKLAQHRDFRCAKSKQEIAKSLQGNYKPEHVFTLKQALEIYDFYQKQIRDCDVETEKLYAAFEPKVDLAEKPLLPRKRQRRSPKGNEPDFDLRTHLYQMTGVDLTQIEGINALTVQKVISEIGLDMSRWPTEKHFTSWLSVCPQNDKTGGKIIKSGTRKTQNRAAAALRMAAQGLANSHGALGGFYRRMRAKLGPPGAITATAHKLARIIYTMLKNQTEYRDPGQGYYEQQYRERTIRNLNRKAKKLGLKLVPVTEPA
jgi:transposase